VNHCDRISEGWQVWLTPRQTRIIYDALSRHEANVGEAEHCEKLVEWFGAEVDAKAQVRGESDGRNGVSA
jgi:hypothetical protein